MPTIAEIVQGADFTVLQGLLAHIDADAPAPDLTGTLASPDNLTFFAPNDAAFGALAAELGFAGNVGNPVDVLALRSNRDLRLVRGGAVSMIFQEPMASFAPAITIATMRSPASAGSWITAPGRLRSTSVASSL